MLKCDWSQRNVIRSAWLEWIVTRQCTRGNGARYIPEYVEVPDWFRNHELGLAITDGPTIFWTLAHLPEINQAHRAMLAGRNLPKPKRSREQKVAEWRRREWRARIRLR